MKTYLLAATLIGALAVPVSAADTFYVMFDKTAKKCSVSEEHHLPRPSSLA